jgi:hypothetical protein
VDPQFQRPAPAQGKGGGGAGVEWQPGRWSCGSADSAACASTREGGRGGRGLSGSQDSGSVDESADSAACASTGGWWRVGGEEQGAGGGWDWTCGAALLRLHAGGE